ncbi:spore germination protein GerPE [Oceanobacillus halophilus]|uniref:Spore germination protein GerPE n=1 Tax=Oceanobacillus halophilus TaxID=930130 RepID=A0A494ZX85_9BACI|nr:spore germination protein GerPE [Oceanobacillus halophilus]RKQ31306.1 spore germination protein GerPE [Oceanobacillus halophilus]
MHDRISNVGQIYTIGISNAGILNIGDSHQATPKARTMAIQKEGPTIKKDLQFEDYSIFRQKANWPKTLQSAKVRKKTIHHDVNINVRQVSLMALSTSSIFQVGNLNKISSEARVKHFRMLQDNEQN